MSWTFSTQAQLGVGPWGREWLRPVPVSPLLTPPTAPQPLAVSAPAHADNKARYQVMTCMTFTGKRGYPQARIDHGIAGDDHLHRYYKKHGTFAGATVYIKSAAKTITDAPDQSSSSTQYQAGDPNPVATAHDLHIEENHLGGQGEEDPLSGERSVKRSRQW